MEVEKPNKLMEVEKPIECFAFHTNNSFKVVLNIIEKKDIYSLIM